MPSAINAMMLAEVKVAVGKSQSLILLDASRLKSDENLKLRKDLRAIGASMKVSKVALLKRAVPENASKMCDGHRSSLGVIICADMVAAAKIVSDLAKDDKIAVRGGLMDGLALDPATIKKISELPGKKQLHGMLVNILAAPLTGLVRVLAEIEKKLQAASPAAPAAPAAAPSAPAADAAAPTP
jgi:large subunit ribosomal protein L10